VTVTQNNNPNSLKNVKMLKTNEKKTDNRITLKSNNTYYHQNLHYKSAWLLRVLPHMAVYFGDENNLNRCYKLMCT